MNSSINSFFLVISPSQEVMEHAAYLKNIVLQSIGHSYNSLHSKAHLSLLQYFDRHNENDLYRISDNIADIKPFNIFLKGLNFFRSNGTIYLDIVNKSPIYDLNERIQKRPIMPHITIARNLNSRDFEIAWKALKDQSYSHYFKCGHVTVLKRVGGLWVPHSNLSLA